MFELDETLARDSIVLGSFPLSLLLLSRDAHYPWFILVPRREGVREVVDLSDVDQQQLFAESTVLSRLLIEVYCADKLNVAALGNMVPQLHIHHIVRYRNDPAWPRPVWGALPPGFEEDAVLKNKAEKLLDQLGAGFVRA